MFNKLHNIYAAEWYKLVKPFGLIDKMLQFIQVLVPALSNTVDSVIAYKYKFVNRQYSFISIKKSDVIYRKDDMIAGTPKYPDYKYVVYNIKGNYEILGCNFTDHIALRGIDYVIYDGLYIFKEHPSKFCYTFEQGKDIVYNTIGSIGDKIHANSYTTYKYPAASEQGMHIYDNIIRTNGSLNFNYIDLHTKGVYTTAGLNGIVTDLWHYNNYTFAILSTGSFVAAHDESNLILNKDEKPVLRDNIKYFTVELDNVHYPVSVGINSLKYYPNLKQYYPELNISLDAFYGLDLFCILKNHGCNFIDIPYINNYTVDSTLLSKGINQGEKFMYLGNALVFKPFLFASDNKVESEAFSDTFISNIKVDIKYVY